MRDPKAADLNIALLCYIARCLEQGDFGALSRLGLDRDDAEAVGALVIADLDHLASYRVPLLCPRALDRNLLIRLIKHVEELRTLKGARDELLALGAPFPMMRHFFGMDSTEYAERGRALGITRPPGRPRELTEEEDAKIWGAYRTSGRPKEAELAPEDYLSLHRATGLPLRKLWLAMRRSHPSVPSHRSRDKTERR